VASIPATPERLIQDLLADYSDERVLYLELLDKRNTSFSELDAKIVPLLSDYDGWESLQRTATEGVISIDFVQNELRMLGRESLVDRLVQALRSQCDSWLTERGGDSAINS
jgi:hypothetical protein